MTRVTKLVLNGFKSFAKFTEMKFGPQYNCVLGANGSGKCLVANSKVYMADGSLVNIGELVNKKIKDNLHTKIDDGVVAQGDSTEILCLDTKTLKIKRRKVQAYIKRTSPKKLVSIRTKTGRMITSTTYHPLFVMGSGGMKSVNAEDLKEGTRIAVPRKLPNKEQGHFYELLTEITPNDNLYVPFKQEFKDILVGLKNTDWKKLAIDMNVPLIAIKGLLSGQSINFAYLVRLLRYAKLDDNNIISRITHVKSKTAHILCKIPWQSTKEFSRLLGYLIAEGRLTDSNQVWFTNSCEEIVNDYTQLIGSLFSITPHIKEYKPHCWDVLVYSRPLQILLHKFGMSFTGTGGKTLTNLYLKNSGETELAEFLNGLYCGDGYISKDSIEITTKSKNLSNAIELILTRLEIKFNSRFVVKTATNSGFTGVYKQITIYGSENFVNFKNRISLIHPLKNKRVDNLRITQSNPNQDLIEINSLIKNVANDLNVNIKRQKKKYPQLSSYVYKGCLPSRSGTNELIDNIFLPIAQSGSVQNLISLQKLSTIASSDILWDEIIEINTIDSNEKWVYDLCVEKDHNFIAENIFVHNSNILDSLCFVLGKTSAKSMRAEKGANLIYNGGKARKPSAKAEVSIFFDNKEKEFPTEEQEVKVTRIIRPNGQSIYKINDQTRTRQQIVDLLGLARIDPDGYNIILQGDIIRFCEMSTTERRLLIEEISGISIYEEKKQKALTQLQKVGERLKEAEIILAERKTYLNDLKKDRDQALKWKEMTDNIRTYKATLIKMNLDKKSDEFSQMEKKVEENNSQIKKQEEKISTLREKIAKKKKEIEFLTKEIEEKGETEQVNLNREIEELKISITKQTSRQETLTTEVSKVSGQKESMNKEIEEINSKITKVKEEKASLQAQKDDLQKEHDGFSAKISKFRSQNNIEQAGEMEKRIEEIDSIVEGLGKEINFLRENQHNLLRKKDLAEHEVSTVNSSIEKVTSLEKEYKKQMDDLRHNRESFKKTTLELNKALDEDSSLAGKLRESRDRLHLLNEEYASLKAKEAQSNAISLSDQAIKAVLEKRKTNQGIYGTVQELGTVDPKFSLALEVAAGSRIRSIVVENEKIAAEEIKYIRIERLGIATFIPLNKIKSKHLDKGASSLVSARGCHGPASDLVQHESKFNKVFSFVFGDTLVVDNIDVARRLGIGAAKMVTLDGDLADISGAMRGGYHDKSKKSRGFRQKSLDKDIEKTESMIASVSEGINESENRRKALEENISSLRSKKAEYEAEIIKAEKSLHLDPSEIGLSKKKKSDLESDLKLLEKDINGIQDKIRGKNLEIAKLKTERQKHRSQINELRDPRLIAELSTYEEKKRQLFEEIVTLETQIKNIDIQIKDIFSPQIKKAKEQIDSITQDSKHFDDELKTISKNIGSKMKVLKAKEVEAKAFYTKFKELFGKRSLANDEINKSDNEIQSITDKLREIEIKTNLMSIKKAEINGELSGLKQEFSEYEGIELCPEKSEDQLKYQIQRFEKMKNEIGSVNMRALEIYEEIEKEYSKLIVKKDTLAQEKTDVEGLMAEIETRKKDLFLKTYDSVNREFQKIFLSLSKKGEASLELENKEDPFAEGVAIKVRISGQRFLDLRSLSGGEKTMTALAFIFAIQEHDPASFYIFDEVDAALDKHNSEKLAKLIRSYSSNAQYIIISHNDSVMSEADTLYGVSMDEHGISKVISLKV